MRKNYIFCGDQDGIFLLEDEYRGPWVQTVSVLKELDQLVAGWSRERTHGHQVHTGQASRFQFMPQLAPPWEVVWDSKQPCLPGSGEFATLSTQPEDAGSGQRSSNGRGNRSLGLGPCLHARTGMPGSLLNTVVILFLFANNCPNID
jgi:hypothetical protein